MASAKVGKVRVVDNLGNDEYTDGKIYTIHDAGNGGYIVNDYHKKVEYDIFISKVQYVELESFGWF